MSWNLKEKVKQLFEQEIHLQKFNFDKPYRCAFLYPNTYPVGMSNMGMHILYTLLNELPTVSCERFFLPDKNDLPQYIKQKQSLYSVETTRKLSDFQVIGVSMSFEGDYFNLLTMLEISSIPLQATHRNKHHPLVIIGGPCATFNPEVLAPVADAFVIGEGEETLLLAVQALQNNCDKTREQQLQLLASIAGVYVPSLQNKTARQWVQNLNKYPCSSAILTTHTEFSKMFITEISRGCGRGCRFCMAGYAFRYPRHRSLATILNTFKRYEHHIERVGLMGPAVSDYPEIIPLAENILDHQWDFSVASLRADSLTPRLAEYLAQSGQKTLTIAPEAGSQRLRNIINKGITHQDIMNAVQLLATANIPNLKLYIMLGLPFEMDEDISELIALVTEIRQGMNKISNRGKLVLSINTFVPKPSTPFQWLPLAGKKNIEDKVQKIRTAFKNNKNIEVNFESYKETVQQALLANGDRTIGQMLIQAHIAGGAKQLLKTLKDNNIDIDHYIYREKNIEEVLPWEHLDMGFSKEYLWQELHRSSTAQMSPNCSTHCKRCGVCTAQAHC